MTIVPDHGGLDRRDRLVVLQARLSDIATVVRLGYRMHPSKARVYPWRRAARGPGRFTIRVHWPGAEGSYVTGCVHGSPPWGPLPGCADWAPLEQCSAEFPVGARERLLAQTAA
jgi:hypothetical protein